MLKFGGKNNNNKSNHVSSGCKNGKINESNHTVMVAKIYKIQKMFNFVYFNLKNIHINTCKNV